VAGLLGTHRYQLDPKGRVSLPKGFRRTFSDGAYLTLGHDGCVFAFPSDEWERRAEEVRSRPLADQQGRALARMFFGSAEAVELDGQGRMVLPQRLRKLAGIGKETVVVGVDDRLEIWDADAWERYWDVHRSAYQAGTLGE
jgi:MraZ protein